MKRTDRSVGRIRLWVLAGILALALILVAAAIGNAGLGSDWHATEFQLQNLDAVPAEFTARFYDPGGNQIHAITDTLGPGMSAYYQPELAGLDPAFTGTLRIETEQVMAGAVMHFATTMIPGFNGNDVFSMSPSDTASTRYYAPRLEKSPAGPNSRIFVYNEGEFEARVSARFFNPDGRPTAETIYFPLLVLGGAEGASHQALSSASLVQSSISMVVDTIPVNGSIVIDLSRLGHLPPEFIGSAVIEADQPIRVDVLIASEEQWAIYPAPAKGATFLYAPLVQQYQVGLVTPTISLQNVGKDIADITIRPSTGPFFESVTLPVLGSEKYVIIAPYPDSYVIESTQPIVAVVGTDGFGGSSIYTALALEQAATRVAAPMLYDDYQEWTTNLWIYNTGAVTNTVVISFTGAPTGTTTWLTEKIGPNQAQVFGPVLNIEHAVAWISGEHPVFGLVEGFTLSENQEDRRFSYWAHPIALPIIEKP